MEASISENFENLDHFLDLPENKKPDGSRKYEVPAVLENGKGFDGVVFNPSTKQAYSGKQVEFLTRLCIAKDLCGQFAGFKQWLELGRVVQKGQKAIKIFVPRFKKTKDNEEKLTSFRMVSVFAYEQTKALDEGVKNAA